MNLPPHPAFGIMFLNIRESMKKIRGNLPITPFEEWKCDVMSNDINRLIKASVDNAGDFHLYTPRESIIFSMSIGIAIAAIGKLQGDENLAAVSLVYFRDAFCIAGESGEDI